MFSKIRKHLNIMVVLLMLLIGILGILLMGVYSIDDYSQDYMLSKVKSDDNVVEQQLKSIYLICENAIMTVESNLNLNNNLKIVLNKIHELDLLSDDNEIYDNIIIVDNNNYYDLKEKSYNNIDEISDISWYKEAENYEDIYVSNVFTDKSNKEYVAICKNIKGKNNIIAVYINIERINKILNIKDIEDAYILNQDNVVISSNDRSLINVSVLMDRNKFKRGYDEIFKDVKILDELKEINTSGGRLLVECVNLNEKLYGVIIRDKTILIQDINNKYLEVLTMIIAAFLLIVAIDIVAAKYILKVREVNNSKCEFIEGIASEIKIPLDSINYMGKMIHDEVEDENVIQHINIILENTHSIAFALNSAFDYSKIANNMCKIENHNYCVNDIIRTVEKVVRCDVQKNNVYFDSYVEGNNELNIFGDQRKIEEIIINLVKVAAQHTIQGGINLKIMYADLTVDRVNLMLIVEDSGIGMTDNELSDFSEELNNVPISLRVGDTGIGIDMVKQLVRILNGKIVVDSTKNVGTIFTIMIPQKIINSDESKWENEHVKSSAVLMGEFSMIKNREKRMTYDTTQIENNKSTTVERREIKKKEESVINDYQVQEQSIIDNYQHQEQPVLDNYEHQEQYAINYNKQEDRYGVNYIEQVDMTIQSNGQDEENVKNDISIENNIQDEENVQNDISIENNIQVEENIQNDILNNNIQEDIIEEKSIESKKTEEVNKDIKFENSISEDTGEDDQVYDIPLPENQLAYITGNYRTLYNEPTAEEVEMQEDYVQQAEESEIQEGYSQQAEETQMQESIEEDSQFEIEQEVQEEYDPRIDKLKRYFEEFGINIDSVVDECEGDIDGYINSLVSFYEYSKTNANRIISLWNNKQIKEYFSAIDVVIEGAKVIGAKELLNILEEQLERGQQGDLKYVAKTIKELFADWKKLLGAIATYLRDEGIM